MYIYTELNILRGYYKRTMKIFFKQGLPEQARWGCQFEKVLRKGWEKSERKMCIYLVARTCCRPCVCVLVCVHRREVNVREKKKMKKKKIKRLTDVYGWHNWWEMGCCQGQNWPNAMGYWLISHTWYNNLQATNSKICYYPILNIRKNRLKYFIIITKNYGCIFCSFNDI